MSPHRAILLVCGVLFALPTLSASPDPKHLAVPPEELSKARELIRKLGSEVYREREDAHAELAKMGRAAKQALSEGALNDADPEVRSRCARLLPKASADDLKARINTFLEDKDAKFEHDLPGLKSFHKTVGTTDKVRALYVEILGSPYNLEMFAAIDKGNVEGGRAISDRRTALWNDLVLRQQFTGGRRNNGNQPTLADITAVLFAETIVNADFIPKSTVQWQQVSGVLFFNQSTVAINALNGTEAHHEAFKVIVRKWLATRTDVIDLSNLAHVLGNSQLKQFPETVPLLRRIVLTDGVQGYSKGYALNYLVQLRGKEETAFLKSLLTNEAMVAQVWFQNIKNPNGQGQIHNCLMKDVALAFLIAQAGQNMKDYGFETQVGNGISLAPSSFGQYAFSSDEKRAAAFIKYGFYRMKVSMRGPDAKEPAPKPKDTPPVITK